MRIFALLMAVVLVSCSPKAQQAKAPQPEQGPMTQEQPAAPTPAAKLLEKPPPTQEPKAAPAPGMREAFPHVRADIVARWIEFDGFVAIDAHDPATPVVYLEVTVCTPDTKEHESLVVTRALPSHIHAVLLAAGYQPGSPGRWAWDGQKLNTIPPTGDEIAVTFAYRDATGKEIEAPATSWIRNAADRGPKFGEAPGSRFVFAGSAMVKRQGREMYDADGSGLLIGLTTFGSESIAWSEIISHDSTVADPEWIADARVVPKFGTPVIVRLRPTSGALAR